MTFSIQGYRSFRYHKVPPQVTSPLGSRRVYSGRIVLVADEEINLRNVTTENIKRLQNYYPMLFNKVLASQI